MSEQMVDVVGLVTVVVEPLIEHKESLEIIPSETSEGNILIELNVHEEDVGKVIGRQGRVIKAIRTLARAAASRMDAHVEVELID
ncbi:MAG: KH domain-containing protein [Eggerthellaceae bacterium]|jgi:predicted RNA-binding protein YlqC (UPF0109 family)|nr:KH domain-containing protein [Eggerthellaceae bacterium]